MSRDTAALRLQTLHRHLAGPAAGACQRGEDELERQATLAEEVRAWRAIGILHLLDVFSQPRLQ